MHQDDSSTDELLPLDDADYELLDHAIQKLEKAWRDWRHPASPPRLRDCISVASSEPRFLTLLVHLIAVDVECRERAGEPKELDAYAQEYPAVENGHRVRELLAQLDCDASTDVGNSSPASHSPARSAGSGFAQLKNGDRINDRYRVERMLGKASFGGVFLAIDEQLARQVAIKVPHPRLGGDERSLERFRTEARLVASLDHPAIVQVYDFGTLADGRCYIVSKYVKGSHLAEKIRKHQIARGSHTESARLVARIADALAYAHSRKVVHRDVKPANILLDEHDTAFIADFGLALTWDRWEPNDRWAGTPVYMSPEQARGDGHHVDGRSDIYSLGAVLYELLCGAPHATGEGISNILDAIRHQDPRPPRQLDHRIPVALEHICLRALKRDIDARYQTAHDMLHDLNEFLHARDVVPWNYATEPPGPLAVVPKGLRSFDEKDSQFFLQLLPGPVNQHGLPGKVQFWKDLLEESNPGRACPVGVIFGPSGSGKSSFVKAALLPHLSPEIGVIFVEARSEGTEERVHRCLESRFPSLAASGSLRDRLAALRTARVYRGCRKVLLVLDQFEQWLHASVIDDASPLVQALRECDGTHVACLLLVRSDFWMPMTRFMNQLAIPLREYENSAGIDLFDLGHARKVLTLLGRAYGKLPDSALSAEQGNFVRRAVDGLAEAGRVISVRLALFAEMMRYRDWTNEALAETGGAEGVAIAYLEETFAGATAPIAHRAHRVAAQAVLRALLPERGAEIKGRARCEDELLTVSGYGSRRDDFRELLRMLDAELRLITPTVHEQDESPDAVASERDATQGGRYYQLTHDYLVGPLREWITRKQRETRRGRAELLLEQRAAVWQRSPHTRHLPSWPEYLRILALSRRATWTPTQRNMMRAATWFHGVRTVGTAGLLALLATSLFIARSARERLAHNQIDGLASAGAANVQAWIETLRPDMPRLTPMLKRRFDAAPFASDERINLAVALAHTDEPPTEFLIEALLKMHDTGVFVLIRDALALHADGVSGRLWNALRSGPYGLAEHLRAAAALAAYDPQSPSWSEIAPVVVPALLDVLHSRPREAEFWRGQFRPVAAALLPELLDIAWDETTDSTSQGNEVLQCICDYSNHDSAALQLLKAWMMGDRLPHPGWAELPLDEAWQDVSSQARVLVASAGGDIAERYAYCHTLAFDQFESLNDDLAKAGYRPASMRPYAHGAGTRLAVVWSRDGRASEWGTGSAQVVRNRHETLRDRRFVPIDIASWRGAHNPATQQYAALWVQEDLPVGRDLWVGVPAAQWDALLLQQYGVRDFRMACFASADVGGGQHLYSAIVERRLAASRSETMAGHAYVADRYPGLLQVDLHAQNVPDWVASNQSFGNRDIEKPDTPGENPALTLAWAQQQYYRSLSASGTLERDLDVAADYLFVLFHQRQQVAALLAECAKWHALLLARLGKPEGCQAALKRYENLTTDTSADEPTDAKFLNIICHLLLSPTQIAEAMEELEQEGVAERVDPAVVYMAARVYAVAGAIARWSAPTAGESYCQRSLQLLQEAIDQGHVGLREVMSERDFEPLWSSEQFRALVDQVGSGLSYTATWEPSTDYESQSLEAMPIDQHLERCRKLSEQGYRPQRIVVSERRSGETTAASVWWRPLVSATRRVAESQRRATLAALLFRSGRHEPALSMLGRDVDPTARSHVIRGLKEAGADVRALVDCLAQASDTAVQAGLVLALGRYDRSTLSASVQRDCDEVLARAYRATPGEPALRAAISG